MNKNKENNLKYTVIPVGRAKDIRGQKFGRLTVVDRVEQKGTHWLCKCDCGNETIVNGGNLTSNSTVSCGCKREEHLHRRTIDTIGNKYGRLTALKAIGQDKSGNYLNLCNCECGKQTIVRSTDLKKGHTKSCGCLRDELSGSRGKTTIKNAHKVLMGTDFDWLKGKNNHNYNHDISDEERFNNRNRNLNLEYKPWVDKVFGRDNHTCQLCNNRGGTLNAHHLNAWNAYPDERFDIDNGITLCTDCHTTFHKEYGYGNNTKEQFNEYLNTIPTLF